MDIVGRRPQTGVFIREDGYGIQTGKAVAYFIEGYPFRIEATRQGVLVRGTFPMVGRDGIQALVDMLIRAVRHHEHLASFPIGQPQTLLSESTLDVEEQMEAALPEQPS